MAENRTRTNIFRTACTNPSAKKVVADLTECVLIITTFANAMQCLNEASYSVTLLVCSKTGLTALLLWNLTFRFVFLFLQSRYFLYGHLNLTSLIGKYTLKKLIPTII